MKRINILFFVVLLLALATAIAYGTSDDDMAVFVDGVKYEIDYPTQIVEVPKGTESIIIRRGTDNSGYGGGGLFPAAVYAGECGPKAVVCDDEGTENYIKDNWLEVWENASYNSSTKEFSIPISDLEYFEDFDYYQMGIYDLNGGGWTLNVKLVEQGTPHTHTPGDFIIENEILATCTEDGSYDEVVYCTECGEVISRETKIIKASGHSWDEGKVTKEPTVDEEGEMTYTCAACGEIKTEVIPKLTRVENVEKIISNLPETVTANDAADIEAAREAYNALTDEEKTLVSPEALAKLEVAEAKLEAAIAKAEAEEAKEKQEAAEAAAAEAKEKQEAAEAAAAEAKEKQEAAEAVAAESQEKQEAAEAAAAEAKEKQEAAEAAAAEAKEKQEAAEAAAAEAQEKQEAADKAAAEAQEKQEAAEAAAAEAQTKLEETEKALAEAQAKLEAAEKEAAAAKLAQKKAEAKNYTVKNFKVTVKNRKFTVKYSKNKKADGYQIQYKLKTAKKYTNLKKATAKLKATTKKLKKGKVYQFRARTYTLVDGKKVYGKWTAVKSVKCK